MSTMKRLQYHQYGGPELMRLENFDLGVPGNGELAIRVHVAAINPIDWKLRQGVMKIMTGKNFPRAMGFDFSGTVIAVGPDVTRFQPGDAVFGLSRFKESGALGQALVTKEQFVAKKPDGVSFEDAACIGTPGITAWGALMDKAGLAAGQRVFINGCAGAVGEASVQVARMHGATVAGSCGAADIERMRALGVQTVYDYRTTDLSAIAERYDVVIDTAEKMTVEQAMGLLNKSGVFLDLHPTPGKFLRALFNRRLKPVVGAPRTETLDKLARAAMEGKFRLPIGRVVPLEAAAGLITELEAGLKAGGKCLVKME
nr:NAD(P)-dependent alcohol dehydrogenase [uncultured Duganella sp.]